jgi:hypothetical protein
VVGGVAYATRAHFAALWERVRQRGYTADPSLPPGSGITTEQGEIIISSRGSSTDQLRALLHEQVHSIPTPRGVAQTFRQQLRMVFYNRSHLVRYAEEAIAEAVAQLGTRGCLWYGVTFPIQEGYVSLGRVMVESVITFSAISGILYGSYEVAR